MCATDMPLDQYVVKKWPQNIDIDPWLCSEPAIHPSVHGGLKSCLDNGCLFKCLNTPLIYVRLLFMYASYLCTPLIYLRLLFIYTWLFIPG